MAQLLVRDIEAAVVKKLRRRAAAEGISVEEAHRRVLRDALLSEQSGPADDFLAYLRNVPPREKIDFPRLRDLPRKAAL